MVEISLVEWSNLNSSLSQQQQPATITWVYCEQYIPCLDWFTPRSVKRVDQKTPDATRHAFYWAWIAGGTNTPSKTSTSRLKICSTLPSVDQYDSEFFASWFKQVGFVERYNYFLQHLLIPHTRIEWVSARKEEGGDLELEGNDRRISPQRHNVTSWGKSQLGHVISVYLIPVSMFDKLPVIMSCSAVMQM